MRFIAVLVILFIGCASTSPPSQDAKGQFDRGMSYFERGKYRQAIETFEDLTFMFPGSELVDDAYFHLAMSYYRDHQYPQASGEFRRFLHAFAGSDFADDAQYFAAMCGVKQSRRWDRDQTYTYRALDDFAVLIDLYPQSGFADSARAHILILRTRLARKAYEVGRIYTRMGRDSSAVISYDEVLASYHDTEWALPAAFEKAEAYMKLGHTEEARALYEEVARLGPESAYRRGVDLAEKARERLAELPLPEDAGGG